MRGLVPLLLAVAACGGEVRDELKATFPLGAPALRRAVADRYPLVITPADDTWPSTAPAVVAEISTSSDVFFDIEPKRADWAAADLRVDPPTLVATTDAAPFDAAELFLGPDDATGIGFEGVKLIARGAIGTRKSDVAQLAFTEEGAGLLQQALQKGIRADAPSTRFVFFLRVTATVTLTPGEALPGAGTDAGAFEVRMPVRYRQ